MANVRLKLDTRNTPKSGYYPITVYVIEGNKQIYLAFGKMTLSHYNEIFAKNSLKPKDIEFRAECERELLKVEKLVSQMKPFDTKVLRQKYEQLNEKPKMENYSLRLDQMFDTYIEQNKHLSLRSIDKLITSKNSFTSHNCDIALLDIDKNYLEYFDRDLQKKGRSISYINGLHRNLRSVINYYTNKLKVVPADYIYPYGKGEYKICDHFPKKQVLSNEEIKKFLSYNKFDTPKQEYARDIWELLYLCNGINLVDLMRLRWDNKKGNCFVIFRKKTQNTRKNHKQEIVIPITDRLQILIDKVGDPKSSFVLGKLKDDYSEQYFENKAHKYRGIINKSLRELSNKLKLSTPVTTSTARDCYATVLNRNGISRDKISEMLNHSSTNVTNHYLGSLDMDETFLINKNLI